MNVKKLLLFIPAFLSSFSNSAQYPGGISGNLKGWYNGNTGISLTAGAVSTWSDISGNSSNATQTVVGSRPSVNGGAFNYNNTIRFNGTSQFLNIPDLMAAGATSVSVFAVARQTGTGNDTWGTIILGQATPTNWTGGGYGITALASGNNSFGFWIRDFNGNFVSSATTLSVPTLMTGNWHGISANNVSYLENASFVGTDPYMPGSVGDNGNSYIGSGIGTGTEFCFYGDIAEIAVYDVGLSAASVNRVESYLGLKYGITLSSNYFNSSGTTIYTNGAPYNRNIIGIGRDDNNNLVQKQSHQYDDSVRIYISSVVTTNTANTGAFGSNNSHVVAGANSGQLRGILSEKPSSIYSRLEREWKLTNTNFSSTFNFDVKLNSAADPTSVNTSHLRLLVDDDGDFSNATVYGSSDGLTFSYANPLITVTGITTVMIPSGATRFITIASFVSSTPLPVELQNFNAIACDNEVCVSWQTASEKNNALFEIEHSADGLSWEKFSKIKGAINSAQALFYSFIDTNPYVGLSYYRLKIIDTEGKYEYSKIVSVYLGKNASVETTICPNPANDYCIVEAPDINRKNLKLYSSLGRMVNDYIKISDESEGKIRIDTHQLQSGSYYLITSNAADNSITQTIKILIYH